MVKPTSVLSVNHTCGFHYGKPTHGATNRARCPDAAGTQRETVGTQRETTGSQREATRNNEKQRETAYNRLATICNHLHGLT